MPRIIPSPQRGDRWASGCFIGRDRSCLSIGAAPGTKRWNMRAAFSCGVVSGISASRMPMGGPCIATISVCHGKACQRSGANRTRESPTKGRDPVRLAGINQPAPRPCLWDTQMPEDAKGRIIEFQSCRPCCSPAGLRFLCPGLLMQVAPFASSILPASGQVARTAPSRTAVSF